MKRRALGLLVLVLHAGVAQAAPRAPAASAAADDHGAAAAATEAAKARFDEGVKHYAKKRYDRALAAFLQAYALTHNPAILFNLGISSVKVGDPLHAVKYFEQFLRDASTATPEQRARAEAAIARAKESLGSIEIIAPDGAEIAVDGEPVGRAPLQGPVTALAGDHAVTITTAAGGKLANVEVKAGMVARVKLSSGASSPPPNEVSGDTSETVDETAPKRPPPPPSEPVDTTPGLFAPPASIIPVYVAGAIGIGAISAAIILKGISANADRNISVGLDALARNGKDVSACTGTETGSLSITCSSLRSALRGQASSKGPFIATLVIGAGSTLFALGWYMFAPKSAPRVGANGLILDF